MDADVDSGGVVFDAYGRPVDPYSVSGDLGGAAVGLKGSIVGGSMRIGG